MQADSIYDNLERYTREELIYGIKCTCAEFEVRYIIAKSEEKRRATDAEKEQRLLKESNQAFEEYSNYLRELCVKYGDGKKVNALKVPLPELEKLSPLFERWQKAEIAWARAIGLT